jgi:hypothetical protein
MPITINCVTNFKEILFIADGVSTPGYTTTSTEAHTTDILKSTWVVALYVVVLVCLLIGGVIVYKSKEIFVNNFLAK